VLEAAAAYRATRADDLRRDDNWSAASPCYRRGQHRILPWHPGISPSWGRSINRHAGPGTNFTPL